MRRYKDELIVLEGSAPIGFLPVCFSSVWIQRKRRVIRIQRQAQLPEKSTKRITTRFWGWTETPLLRSFENRTSDWLLSTIPTGAVTQRSYPFPGRLMRSSRKSRWRTASSPTRRRNKCTMSMARRESRKEPTRSSTNRSIRSTSSPPSSLRDSMMTPFRFLPSVISFRHRENTGRGTTVPEPIEVHVTCTLSELYKGAVKKVRVTHSICCKECKGTGAQGSPSVCNRCNGKGVQVTTRRFGSSISRTQKVCSSCKGTGRFVKAPIVATLVRERASSRKPNSTKSPFRVASLQIR